MIITGNYITFGGTSSLIDAIKNLSLYDDNESRLRPDLFYPFKFSARKNLNPASMYCAFLYPKDLARKRLQETPIKIINIETKCFVMAWLVDDLRVDAIGVSDGVERALKLKPDSQIKLVAAYPS